MNNRKLPSIQTRLLLAAAVAGILTMILVSTDAPAGDFRIFDTTPAYNSKQPQDWGAFSHWDLREFPNCQIPWTMGTNPVADLNGNGVANEAADRAIAQSTFAASFGRWDAVTPNPLGFVNAASNVPAGGFLMDGWNTISFGVLDSTTFGQAEIFRSVSTGRILEGDVILNNNTHLLTTGTKRVWVTKAHGSILDWDVDTPPIGNFFSAADPDTDYNGNGVREFEADAGKTATHEIGHFLGLAHCEPLGGVSNNPNNPIMEQYTAAVGPHHAGWTNLVLKNPDRDGMNFLYCPDLGDAPDPWMGVFNQYPSKVHGPNPGRTLNGLVLNSIALGAEHVLGIKQVQPSRNWTYEWLARGILGVNAECEANLTDKDPFDDGVTWYPNPPVWGRPLTVVEWARYASDNVGNRHNYAIHPMFGNAWMDINQDCIWQEHFLHQLRIPPPLPGNNVISQTTMSGSIFLPLIVNPSLPVWMRCRLDWGEDAGAVANIDGTLAGPAGAAQFGEVEDYPFYCTTRYEQMHICIPYFFPVTGFSMVVVGPPDPSDQVFAAQVDASDCIQAVSTATTNYVPSADETVVWYPFPVFPFSYWHIGRCRPNYPPASPPQTTLRVHMTTPAVPCGAPRDAVPRELKVPTVNPSYRLYGPNDPNSGKVLFSVGAVDYNTGGWIAGPDTLTHAWQDTLRVSVSYRVSPNLVPLASLSPCDPLYSALPLHPVGDGLVTPEDAFEFLLSTPGDVPTGSFVILEVQSSWSTNALVNHEILEFPVAMGTTTGVRSTQPPPRELALENYPNPFNPTTTIRYALPLPVKVTLGVYDVGGHLVRSLLRDARKPAGVFEARWDGTDDHGNPVSSGVYFYRLTAGSKTLTRKAVLLK